MTKQQQQQQQQTKKQKQKPQPPTHTEEIRVCIGFWIHAKEGLEFMGVSGKFTDFN